MNRWRNGHIEAKGMGDASSDDPSRGEEAVKTMKKRTVIRAPTFVWAVLVILLVSSTIGTIVWAKPTKPSGKLEPPPPEPETAMFRILIGVEWENVTLTQPNYFDVVTTDEGWYHPSNEKPRGRGGLIDQWGSWGIPLGEGRYGVYTMQPVWSTENETYLTDWYHGEEAQLFGLEHYWDRYTDYWQIGINWTADLNGDGELDPLMLIGCTDRGPEPEGSYDAANDVWTITFTTTNAYFGVGWCDGAGCWLYWCGYLEFTVTIQKNPSS